MMTALKDTKREEESQPKPSGRSFRAKDKKNGPVFEYDGDGKLITITDSTLITF